MPKRENGFYEIHYPCCRAKRGKTSVAFKGDSLREEAATWFDTEMKTFVDNIIIPLHNELKKIDSDILKIAFPKIKDSPEYKLAHAKKQELLSLIV